MCGVAAIFAYGVGAPPVDVDELGRLRSCLRKRGPDSEGEWRSADTRLGLAHTRLAIIDLDTRADQPMMTADKRLVISFNGEIYNYRELREELVAKGYGFHTTSDTEVLLYMYQEYGQHMLLKLIGMFAFVIWDDERSTLFAARDPYGIKPLYYSDDGSTLRLASQVGALRDSRIESREQDPAGIVGFYLFGHIPEPYTLYRSVRALPSGCFLLQSAGQSVQVERYASIAGAYHNAARQDAGGNGWDAIEDALAGSVDYHMVSDVPVALFLSSGIDSGLLLASLSKTGHQPVSTVTVTFDEYRHSAEDEAPMAAEVASRFGAKHETIRLSETEMRSDLFRFLEAMDQPTIDGLNTWLISRSTSRCGFKVALSGIGGDELFGGYPSYVDLPRWQNWFGRGGSLPLVNSFLASMLKTFSKLGLPINPKALSLPSLGQSWPGAYLVRRGLFMPEELELILGRDLARAGLDRLQPIPLIESEIEPDPGNSFVRVSTLESSLYLKNQLLRDTDWASMDHSLEVRTPFVDWKLLSRLAPTIRSMSASMNKQDLAERADTQMPEGWAVRKKTGFTVPMHDWLRSVSDLGEWRRHSTLNNDNCHWSRRWAYTIMALTQDSPA